MCRSVYIICDIIMYVADKLNSRRLHRCRNSDSVAEKSVRWEQSVHSSTVQHEGTDCLGSVTVIMSPAVLHKGVSLHSMKLFMWTWQSAPGAMTQPNKVTSHVNMCWQQRSICQFVSWEADKVHDDWMQMRLANTYFTAACSFYTLFSCLIWDLQV